MAETENDPEQVSESQAETPLSEELLNEVSGGTPPQGDLNFTLN